MSKRSLAKHWQEMDIDQKRDFVSAFSNLLARTYIDKIELIRKGMVEVVSNKDFPPTTSGVERASVKTMVTHKGEKFPIEYRLYRKGDEDWKVYDVIVENIGLVSNYRTEFSSIIRKKGISGLITDIKAKQ
jgi:phospholipid transport system substrate-binding protein